MGWSLLRVLVITLAVGASAACGGGDQAVLVRHDTPSTVAASATKPTPTTAVVATTVAPAPDAPATTAVVKPATAAIEVHDAPGPGWHGMATVIGPGGTRTASLEGGSATFDGLGEGVYSVTVSRESDAVPPSDDGTGIGTSSQILDAGRYGLVPGDRAVVTCNETTCTGVL